MCIIVSSTFEIGCIITFRIILGLVHHSKKDLGGVAYQYMLILAKTKPQNMYNGVRNKFEIMHIRVGHIRNRVYAPSSNLFGLGFPTQNNLGGVTREEMLKWPKMSKMAKTNPKDMYH